MYHLCWQNGNSKLRIQSCKHCLGDVSRDPQSSAERLQCCQLAAALTHAVSHNICAKNVGLTRPKNASRMYLQHFTARSATPGSLIATCASRPLRSARLLKYIRTRYWRRGLMSPESKSLISRIFSKNKSNTGNYFFSST